MMTFEDSVVKKTVDKLIKGDDYRQEVVTAISMRFLDFTIDFFKQIVKAKFDNKDIDMDWYKENFIVSNLLTPEEVVINSGLNKKTVSNIYGSAKREIMLNAAETNYDYLYSVISELEEDSISDIAISIKITYNGISVELNLSESLIVINTLATKKIQIRGGAWSSIGKKVEKPLLDRLCYISGVPGDFIDNSIFVKDKNKKVDREVDYFLFNSTKSRKYRIEVKLMGKGNPESADAIIARDSDIFVADTLSEQNKNQCENLNIKYLELKNNDNVIDDFKLILQEMDIPFNK